MNKNEGTVNVEMPLMAWRFKLTIRSSEILRGNQHEQALRFTNQVEKCVFDYVNNTLTITARQPAEDCGFTEIVQSFKGSTGITVDFLNGQGGDRQKVVSELHYQGRMIEHEFALAYGERGVAYHRIVLKLN